MELKTKQRNLPGLIGDINRNKYNFNHPLQRCEGQWSILQKSELIDSVLRDYSIDPVTIVITMIDENTGELKELNNAIIDGVQRLSTFRDFLNNEFKLSKKLENEPFTIDDIQYYPSETLHGKKYEDLDEKIKDKLNSFDVILDMFSQATEKEIRELFRRKNSGKPLTNAQKNSVKISDDLYSHIKTILDADGYTIEVEKKNRAGEVIVKDGKPVMNEKKIANLWHRIFSVGIFKNSEDRNIILEIMMLISGYGREYEFGFRNEDIETFIIWFNEQENKEEVIDQIIKAADSINKRVTDKIPNLKKTSIPMVVAGMCRVIKYKGGKDKYMEKVQEFFKNYDFNEDYKKLVGSGSASKENVQARWEVFKNIAKNC